jgi:hypothetical protein
LNGGGFTTRVNGGVGVLGGVPFTVIWYDPGAVAPVVLIVS